MRAEKVTGASGASTVVNAAKKQEAANAVVAKQEKINKANDAVKNNAPNKHELVMDAADSVLGKTKLDTVTNNFNAAKVPSKENKIVSEAAAKKSAPDHSFAISEMEKLKGQVQQAHVKAQNTRPNTASSSENKKTPYSPAYQGGSNSWENKLNNSISNFFTS